VGGEGAEGEKETPAECGGDVERDPTRLRLGDCSSTKKWERFDNDHCLMAGTAKLAKDAVPAARERTGRDGPLSPGVIGGVSPPITEGVNLTVRFAKSR